ncbi:MAG: YraN family protein [Coraliomargarita sp.]
MNLFHRICEQIFRKRQAILPKASSRAERGRFGEDLAADYCRQELGYRPIARNWRYKRDELDLICRDGEVLVFIEVRTRDAAALVSGLHSVDAKKKATLLRACKRYIKQLPKPPKHFRFDVIDVALHPDGRGEPRHYQNVALFNKHYSAQSRLS